MVFCFALPFFCFSRSFFFRVTSPPPTFLPALVVSTSLRRGGSRSRARDLVPTRAWMTTSKSWRGTTALSRAAAARPRRCASPRAAAKASASTATPLSATSTLTTSAAT